MRRRRDRFNIWWRRESAGGADHLDDTSTGWCCDRQPVRHDPKRCCLLHGRWDHAHSSFAAVPGAFSGGVESHGQGDCCLWRIHHATGQHGREPELLGATFLRGRWSGATSSTSPPVLQLSRIPRSGPTTPATAVLATANWRPTAPGDLPLRHAAQRIPVRMWVRTRERMGFCISWHSSRRPRCTPRRG